MRIVQQYSHLNGLEFLEARHSGVLKEIYDVIGSVDANACRTKISKEKTMLGKVLYSPRELNRAFKRGFNEANSKGWHSVTTNYWVCEDPATNRMIVDMPALDQRKTIAESGFLPIKSSNQTDFVNERVAVEVQFGKYAFVAYDLFVKHMAFYVGDKIDVGIEILPMKSLQAEMSSGPAYYEGQLFNLIREGRGVPPVPLVLMGVGL